MLTLLIALLLAHGAASARPPNVVIFYADDMGIGDAGCYGCRDIRTPSIDALAQSGVRFTNYYSAAPICSPSRTALLTGQYPCRAGASSTRNIGSEPGDPGLPGSEVTIAELVKPRGYASAILGKWHQGFTPESVPNAQGFDLFVGFHASALDYYSHMYYFSEPYHHDLYRNRDEIFLGGRHMTDLIQDEAIRFIDGHKEQPFLLYCAFNAPHYPMAPQARFIEMYKHLPQPRRQYAALVAGMDEAIGKIMDALRERRLTRDTLVFFSSDNGAADASPREEGGGSNAPFRGWKRSLFDGGIRMPAMVSWPGTVPAGETRDQVVIAMDLFATVAEVSGAAVPKDRTIDGRSWMPIFKNAKAPGHETLFFEWAGQHAVRQGRWKLVCNAIVGRKPGKTLRLEGEDAIFLSDIEADPGETKNLRKEHPEIVGRLLKLHEEWWKPLGKPETDKTDRENTAAPGKARSEQ
jgi:arylsulfatase A